MAATETDDITAEPEPTGNYPTAHETYISAGWPSVLPLPPKSKTPPPRGCTGADGRWPSAADVFDWSHTQPEDCNIALRVPPDIIGLDIDQYGTKRGRDNLTEATATHRLPELPPTWSCSARDGTDSGIYFYRVPDGTRLRGEAVPDVETIQHHHRYAVVWPSVHPKGTPYRWRSPDGLPAVNVPDFDDLADLPPAWVDYLTDRTPDTLPAQLPPPLEHRETSWAQPVTDDYLRARTDLLTASPGSRHGIARDRCMALCRHEQTGLPGATAALDMLGQVFLDAVSVDRGSTDIARGEWARMLAGGRTLAQHTVTAAQIAQERARADTAALLPPKAPTDPTAALTAPQAPSLHTWAPHPGGDWIFDAPVGVPALWGTGDEVLWAEGEPLLIVAPPGVGKTTLMGQLVRGLIGLSDQVLRWPVQTRGRVLLIAGDRPRQITRSYRRHFTPEERETLNERLIVCAGPPPGDFARHPDLLREMCEAVDANVVILDSLKDMAVGLSDDEVGAGLNRAIQITIAAGIDVGALHHQRKGQNGVKPKSLEDVYGSTWIAAGAGSVVLLWGAAGSPLVEMVHLKQPAAEVGPFQIEHDHNNGVSRIAQGFDLIAYLRNVAAAGATVADVARAKFNKTNPTENERKKAERDLEAKVKDGLVVKEAGIRGGSGGSSPARFWLVGSKDGSKDAGLL